MEESAPLSGDAQADPAAESLDEDGVDFIAGKAVVVWELEKQHLQTQQRKILVKEQSTSWLSEHRLCHGAIAFAAWPFA